MSSGSKTMEAGNTDQTSGSWKRWLPVGILVAVMGYAFANGWHNELTLSNLIQNRDALATYVSENYTLSIVAFMGLYIAAVALSFPGASLITIAAGFVFGFIPGGIITAIAATIGATIIFSIAKTSFGATLNEKAGPRMQKLASGLKENAFSYLLFLRLVPLFPFWLINLAPALFNVPVRTYIVATFIGILPGTFAYTLLGEGLDSLVAAQEAANPGCAASGTCEIDLAAAVTPEIIAAIVVLAVVSLIPIVLKRLRGNKA